MTSSDLRDVLNLPADHAAGPRPSKKQKLGVPRPNLKGLAREVQNLGGDNPISIVPEARVFKKRRLAARKPVAKWELKAFTNSARKDGTLVLRHWKRIVEESSTDPTDNATADLVEGESSERQPEVEGGTAKNLDVPEDSAFAKFNVEVDVPQYSDDQYTSNLQHLNWTKEETDYLLQLCKDFDLRWIVIWDRYEFKPSLPASEDASSNSQAVVAAPKARSMEDLKARYYEVAHKMMAVQKPAQYMTRPEFELYEMMQKFNPVQETARKQFAINTMARSKDEAREEESLLLEVKRILARTERLNEERYELYQRLDFPSSETDISAFKSSQGLQNLLQTLMNVDKSKKRRSIMSGPAGSDGVSPGGPVPGSAVSEVSVANRRESIAAASGSGHRDSIATPITPAESAGPGNKKKGQQLPERRKLSEREEQVYGVSHHDRLTSGATFRYEKIHKLYSHKSGQQQQRISNVLIELGIPTRLSMVSSAIVSEFEQLWGTVNSLIDMRKVSDKLDAEIKTEEEKKKEREKLAEGASAAPTGDSIAVEKAPGAAADKASDNLPAAGEKPAGPNSPVDKQLQAQPEKYAATPGTTQEKSTEKPLTNGNGPQEAQLDAVMDAPEAKPDEVDKDNGETNRNSRPGSSGAHKRSASVLSTTSDKSAKRQKK